MNDIQDMRRQHDAAEEMAAGILALTQSYRDEYDAVPILRLLRKLHALLRVHFAYEDWVLYPAMIRRADEQAARVAEQFQAEMGGLAEEFEDFVRRWSTCVAIAADIEAFSNEVTALLGALGARIERENDLLYPLATRVAAPAFTARRAFG